MSWQVDHTGKSKLGSQTKNFKSFRLVGSKASIPNFRKKSNVITNTLTNFSVTFSHKKYSSSL